MSMLCFRLDKEYKINSEVVGEKSSIHPVVHYGSTVVFYYYFKTCISYSV